MDLAGIILAEILLAHKLDVLLPELLHAFLVGVQQPLDGLDILRGRELLLLLFGVFLQVAFDAVQLFVDQLEVGFAPLGTLYELAQLREFVL